MLDLKGKVAFVAGAGSVAEGWGNGRATAVLLARQGAKVFGTDYSAEALAGTTIAMDSEGLTDWAGFRADMTSSDQVQAAVEACLRATAGSTSSSTTSAAACPGTPVSLSVEEWDGQMDRNLKTAFLGCKHVLPVMERQFEAEGRAAHRQRLEHREHELPGRRARPCRLRGLQGGPRGIQPRDRHRLCEEGHPRELGGGRDDGHAAGVAPSDQAAGGECGGTGRSATH